MAASWAHEVESLMRVDRLFDGFVEVTKRVSSTCLIHLERNRYSVPASFANRPVSLRVYPDKLVVAAEGHVVCQHPRVIDRTHNGPGRTVYDWRHYLAVIQRKPGALRNGAPFLELPEAFKRLQHHLLRHIGGDREMVEILALVLHHDEQAVLVAVELATSEHMQRLFHEGHQQSKLRRAEIDQCARRCMQSPSDNIEPPASEREDAIGAGRRCTNG
jgi:hypothetical protein